MKKKAEESARPDDASRTGMLQIFSEAGKVNSNNKNNQFWKQSLSRTCFGNNHPMLLATEKFITQKINYLHENPVRAGFVNNAADWQYSSAIDYYKNKKGMIEISML